MKLNKNVVLFVLVMSMLFICGCFEYEDIMTIHKDNTGTLAVHYCTLKDSDMDWKGMRFPKEKNAILDEIRNNYTSPNVKLVRFQLKEKEKYRHVYFTVKFEHVTDLNDIRHFADSRISFIQTDPNRILFKRIIHFDDEEDDDDDADESAFGQAILEILETSIFDNIKFRFELNLPEKVDETNANWVRAGNQMVWKYTVSDFIKDKNIVMIAQTQ